MLFLTVLLATEHEVPLQEIKEIKEVKTFLDRDVKDFGRYVSLHCKSLNIALAEVPITYNTPIGLSTDLNVKLDKKGYYKGLAVAYGWHF